MRGHAKPTATQASMDSSHLRAAFSALPLPLPLPDVGVAIEGPGRVMIEDLRAGVSGRGKGKGRGKESGSCVAPEAKHRESCDEWSDASVAVAPRLGHAFVWRPLRRNR